MCVMGATAAVIDIRRGGYLVLLPVRLMSRFLRHTPVHGLFSPMCLYLWLPDYKIKMDSNNYFIGEIRPVYTRLPKVTTDRV